MNRVFTGAFSVTSERRKLRQSSVGSGLSSRFAFHELYVNLQFDVVADAEIGEAIRAEIRALELRAGFKAECVAARQEVAASSSHRYSPSTNQLPSLSKVAISCLFGLLQLRSEAAARRAREMRL